MLSSLKCPGGECQHESAARHDPSTAIAPRARRTHRIWMIRRQVGRYAAVEAGWFCRRSRTGQLVADLCAVAPCMNAAPLDSGVALDRIPHLPFPASRRLVQLSCSGSDLGMRRNRAPGRCHRQRHPVRKLSVRVRDFSLRRRVDAEIESNRYRDCHARTY